MRLPLRAGALLALAAQAAARSQEGDLCWEVPGRDGFRGGLAAVYSRDRGQCAQFCATAPGRWRCASAADVQSGCAEAPQGAPGWAQANCGRSWGTKVCLCEDIGDTNSPDKSETAAASVPQTDAAPDSCTISTAEDTGAGCTNSADAEEQSGEALVEIWDGVLPPALAKAAAAKHAQMNSITHSRGKRKDRSLNWVDLKEAPEVLERPQDYMEGIVASLIEGIPRLRELRDQWDVVEFFSHSRKQSSPQWFHFDAAEFAAYDSDVKTVRVPTYSAVLYLSDEVDAHFAMLGPRINCTDSVGAAETLACPAGGVASFVPGVVRSATLVRPSAGRVVLLDGARLHGTLPGVDAAHPRDLIGFCFYRRRPTMPPTPPDGHRGGRKKKPFGMPKKLRKAAADSPSGGWAERRGARPTAAALGSAAAPLLAPLATSGEPATGLTRWRREQGVPIVIKVPGSDKQLRRTLPLPSLAKCDVCRVNFKTPVDVTF
eukprot:TRINITY_DN47917_c0_g1_i1.p1 TRINITY_DN47917_c0_g1~~TRINITY_DN47917_c0_g1_i1.p1  ORF type:complete len:511 (+),score=137.68 TRINITY_DN47917_c0_g1_i1:71-1534(+)